MPRINVLTIYNEGNDLYWVPELKRLQYIDRERVRLRFHERKGVVDAKHSTTLKKFFDLNDDMSGPLNEEKINSFRAKELYFSNKHVEQNVQDIYGALEAFGLGLPLPVQEKELVFWVGSETPKGEWIRWLVQKCSWGKFTFLKRLFDDQYGNAVALPASWVSRGIYVDVKGDKSWMKFFLLWFGRLNAFIIALGTTVVLAASKNAPLLGSILQVLAFFGYFLVIFTRENNTRLSRVVNSLGESFSGLYKEATRKMSIPAMAITVGLTGSLVISSVILGLNQHGLVLGIVGSYGLALGFSIAFTFSLIAVLFDLLLLTFSFNRALPEERLVVKDLNQVAQWASLLQRGLIEGSYTRIEAQIPALKPALVSSEKEPEISDNQVQASQPLIKSVDFRKMTSNKGQETSAVPSTTGEQLASPRSLSQN